MTNQFAARLEHWRLKAVKERLQGKRGWAHTMLQITRLNKELEEAREKFKGAMVTMNERLCPPKSRGDRKMTAQQARLMAKLVHQEFKTRSR